MELLFTHSSFRVTRVSVFYVSAAHGVSNSQRTADQRDSVTVGYAPQCCNKMFSTSLAKVEGVVKKTSFT